MRRSAAADTSSGVEVLPKPVLHAVCVGVPDPRIIEAARNELARWVRARLDGRVPSDVPSGSSLGPRG